MGARTMPHSLPDHDGLLTSKRAFGKFPVARTSSLRTHLARGIVDCFPVVPATAGVLSIAR